jgi:hypothetical protein
MRDRYLPFGFELIGTIHQVNDPRGFEINYLKGGDTVLEVFTFDAPTTDRTPQLNALGFSSLTLAAAAPSLDGLGDPIGLASDGSTLYADADGLVFAVAP